MNQDIIDRIANVLKEQMDSSVGIKAIERLVGMMDEGEAAAFAKELEDMASYRDYLSEEEARCIVDMFTNFDGSLGAKWGSPDLLFDAVCSLGIHPEVEGRYNRWSFFAVMNMVWSDEWGILKDYISANDEVKVVAELAQARLLDKDRKGSVRRYFGLE